ncbi:GtrA family protein [Pontibacter korlensis]|uniref:Glycosyl transferase family 2 n=1 Tax=Pontibacter korlensis TaxID=400092 RepID=A0A0E3ZDN3_9BACT|nr:GtrA family protein [Pontibacter korlensis]AKD02390.1 glycosyl transferase family 2 [Pontibacter korlensis]
MSESLQSLFFKFLKFGVVGFSGLLLDFGVTYLVKEKLRWNKYIANSLGFLLASASNYYLNRIWTFHSADPEIGWQYSKFLAAALIGLILNNLIIYLLTNRTGINFYIAKFCAIVLVFFWNFFINYLYTFTR